MANPKKWWLEKEAKANAENSIETLAWYMQEYKEHFSYLEVAEIFSKAYLKLARQVAREMEESDKEEL